MGRRLCRLADDGPVDHHDQCGVTASLQELAARGKSRMRGRRSSHANAQRDCYSSRSHGDSERTEPFAFEIAERETLTISIVWLLSVLFRDVSIPFCARRTLVGPS